MFNNLISSDHVDSRQSEERGQESVSPHFQGFNHQQERRRRDILLGNFRGIDRNRAPGARVREQEVQELAHNDFGCRIGRGV